MNAPDHLAARLAEHPEIVFCASLRLADVAMRARIPIGTWLSISTLRFRITSASKLRCQLAAELDDLGEVDVVVLNDAPPLLGHRALMGRRVLVRDPVALVRYQVRTIAQSEDERYWRELNWRALRQRIKEGRFGRS